MEFDLEVSINNLNYLKYMEEQENESEQKKRGLEIKWSTYNS